MALKLSGRDDATLPAGGAASPEADAAYPTSRCGELVAGQEECRISLPVGHGRYNPPTFGARMAIPR
jgi:hypothetical protein